MDGEPDLDLGSKQQFDELIELLLALGRREAIARHDDDALGVAHLDPGVGRFRGPFCSRDGAVTRLHRSSEVGEEDVGDRAVHGLGHEQGEQQARRADHHARDHQSRVAQNEAFQTDRQAGESVVDRDHHRHVGAADRQGHQDAEGQGEAEEYVGPGRDRQERLDAERRHTDNPACNRDGRQEDQAVQDLLTLDPQGLLDDPLELGPGNDRARHRYRADQSPQ